MPLSAKDKEIKRLREVENTLNNNLVAAKQALEASVKETAFHESMWQESTKRCTLLEQKNKELVDKINSHRADVSELKAMIADRDMTIARQSGYLHRAIEDDMVRELGPTDQPPPQIPQSVYRRGAPDASRLVGRAAQPSAYGERPRRSYLDF